MWFMTAHYASHSFLSAVWQKLITFSITLHAQHIDTLGFCLTGPFFQSYSKLGYSRLGQNSKINSGELLWRNFYRLDALPVAQPTSLKHWNVTEVVEVSYTVCRLIYAWSWQGGECGMYYARMERRNLVLKQWSFSSKWKSFQLHLVTSASSGTSITICATLQATFLVTIFAWKMIH